LDDNGDAATVAVVATAATLLMSLMPVDDTGDDDPADNDCDSTADNSTGYGDDSCAGEQGESDSDGQSRCMCCLLA